MSLPRAYAPFVTFCAPARPRAALWRVVLVVAGFETAFSVMPAVFAPLINWRWSDAVLSTLDYAGFGIILLILLALVRLLHHRGWRSMTGPGPAFRRDLGRVLLAVSLVLLVQQSVDLAIDGPNLSLTPTPGLWLLWLVPAICAIGVQVTTEEVFFRGYLTQQLAAISQQRRVWILLPSVYFGASHLLNGDGPAAGLLWAVWAGMLGAACADLTARTGNLGAAIGLHLGNNLFAALVLGYTGMPGSGLALVLLPFDAFVPEVAGLDSLLSPLTLIDIMFSASGVLVMWLAARVAIRA